MRRRGFALLIAGALLEMTAPVKAATWERKTVGVALQDPQNGELETAQRAAGLWAQAPGTPRLRVQVGGRAEVEVRYREMADAGWTDNETRDGVVRSSVVQMVPGADLGLHLHEFGHLLGLGHNTCPDSMMGPNPSCYSAPSDRDLHLLSWRYGAGPRPEACPKKKKGHRRGGRNKKAHS